MNRKNTLVTTALATAIGLLVGGSATATEPCGDFGECKVLVEINSSDGDIGFHFLMDGDDLRRAFLFNPKHRKLFAYTTRRELGEQFLTETFAESAEPLCFDPTTDDDEENDDEDFVTLTEFLDRWDAGTYKFFGIGDDWELSYGESELTFNLPAAPVELEYEEEIDGDDVDLAGGERGLDLHHVADRPAAYELARLHGGAALVTLGEEDGVDAVRLGLHTAQRLYQLGPQMERIREYSWCCGSGGGAKGAGSTSARTAGSTSMRSHASCPAEHPSTASASARTSRSPSAA